MVEVEAINLIKCSEGKKMNEPDEPLGKNFICILSTSWRL